MIAASVLPDYRVHGLSPRYAPPPLGLPNSVLGATTSKPNLCKLLTTKDRAASSWRTSGGSLIPLLVLTAGPPSRTIVAAYSLARSAPAQICNDLSQPLGSSTTAS